MLWAAEAPANTFADPITWIQFGALGLVVLGFLVGYIWPRPAVDRLKDETARALAERDKANQQRDVMAETFQTQLLPVLTEFLTTTRALLPVLQRLVDRTGGDR